ncbi:MAG: hypothetical protein NZ555_13665, partial [Geminicoccaceae bacterium]|nr:hypothetical protein [Geminicoccaceae bacterium]
MSLEVVEPPPAVGGGAEAGESAVDPAALVQARTAWRTRYLQARTALIELQLQERQARLVSAERVRQAVYRAAAEIRDAWLVWPSRVAGEVANELGADPRVVEQVLDRLVREQLEEL